MIAWRRVPWSLWLFSVLLIAGAARIVVLDASDTPVEPLVFVGVLAFAWAYFLLKGVTWLWIGTVALNAVGFAFDVIDGSVSWPILAMTLIQLALLLLPITQRFFLGRVVLARA